MRYIVGLLAILSFAAVAAAEPPEKPAVTVQCTLRPLSNEITLGVPFGVEVTLTNVSDMALSLPDPRSDEAWDNGMNHEMFSPKGASWSESFPVRPAKEGCAGRNVALAPKTSLRYRVWAFWDYQTNYAKRTVAGHFSPVPPGPGVLSYYFNVTDFGPKPDAPSWKGVMPQSSMAINMVRIDPSKAVAMTLDVAAKEKGSEVRSLAREALASITCWHFGKGPGLADADIAEAAKWLEANKGKSRDQWIVNALRSPEGEDRHLAATLIFGVKDPDLLDSIIATLPRDKGMYVSDRVLDALWTNYGTKDPRALDFARNEIRTAQYGWSMGIIQLAVKHKVEPIMKEGGEVLLGLLKTELAPDQRIYVIKMAASCKAEGLPRVLEEMDQRQPLDQPLAGVVIQTLSEVEGADYRPRLLKYLENKDPGFRCVAAFCLQKNGDNHCLDGLIKALSDPDKYVRVAAFNSMLAQWHDATPQQYDKAMETLLRLVDRVKPDDELPLWQLVMGMTALNPDVTPPEPSEDKHKVAEAWRTIWQEARKKK